MDIALYISSILDEQDEVGVPGLGTFYKKKSPARYNSSNNQFYPPGYQIDFKEGPTSNPSLSQYISKAKNISEPSADYFAEKYGSLIKKSLASSGTFELGELGILKNNDAGIIFEAQGVSTDPDNFGLINVPEPDYVMAGHPTETTEPQPATIPAPEAVQTDQNQSGAQPPVHEVQADTLISPDPLVSPPGDSLPPDDKEISPAAPLEESAGPIAGENSPSDIDHLGNPFTGQDDTEIEEVAKRNRVIEIIAVVVVIGLTIAGYLYREQLNTLFLKPDGSTKTIPPASRLHSLSDSIMSADSIVDALKKQGLDAEKPLDTVNVSTKSELIKAPGAVKSYDIIGPSFAKAKQAEAFIRQMHSKGIYAYVINLPGPRIKVALGSFKDEASAQLELPRIQKDIYPGAYVQQIKNK